MWTNRRNITEYSEDLLKYDGTKLQTVWFRKAQNRWYWGWQITMKGVKYNDHPFATQREAKRAARDDLYARYEEGCAVAKAIREMKPQKETA